MFATSRNFIFSGFLSANNKPKLNTPDSSTNNNIIKVQIENCDLYNSLNLDICDRCAEGFVFTKNLLCEVVVPEEPIIYFFGNFSINNNLTTTGIFFLRKYFLFFCTFFCLN